MDKDHREASALPRPEDLLPHRAPLLLVDRIVAFDSGVGAKAELYIRGDEFWCAAHFPGYPVMPGVLLVEAMAQVAAIAEGAAGQAGADAAGTLPLLAAVKNARFVAQARPGMKLTIDARIGRTWAHFGMASCTVSAEDGSKVAECEITYARQQATAASREQH